MIVTLPSSRSETMELHTTIIYAALSAFMLDL